MALAFGYSETSMTGDEGRVIFYVMLEFSVYPSVSRKPLRNFEQKNDMTRFIC